MDESMKMKWEGRWDQLKGKAKQAWGDLTDDDLDVAEGEYDELVGKLEERTGETREAIEDKLNA
ncbi:MAG TPA: CsbD family protein [Acidimicrobiia bacterium]|nr:CsbD family protein [Acidimicrobiia bacterium]